MSNSEPVSSLKGIGEKTGNYLKSWGSSLLMTFFPIIQELMIPMSRLCL